MRTSPLALASVLALVGCGPSGFPEGNPIPTGQRIGSSALVSPEPDLENPTPAGVRRFDLRGGGDTVLVHYAGADHRCYGLDHVDVEYRQRVVAVAVYEGQRPGVDMCTDIGIFKVVKVALDEPLGDRRLIDALSFD